MNRLLAISVTLCAILLEGGTALAQSTAACQGVPANTDQDCSQPAIRSSAQDVLQRRLDRTIGTLPNARIEQRLDGTPSGPTPDAAPLTLTPGDDIEFATSLSQWGAWLTRQDAEAIERAKTALPDGLAMPRSAPATRKSLDVWTRARTTSYLDEGGHLRSRALTTYLGTDYAPVDGVVLGGLVQLDRNADHTALTPAAADSLGYMAGPYVGLRLVPGVTVDATMAWGRTQDQLTGPASWQSHAERRLARASIKGDWSWQGWKFAPTATVQMVEEAAFWPNTVSGLVVQRENLTLAPRISHRTRLGSGLSLESFMRMSTTVDIESAAPLGGAPATAVNTIGGGLTLTQDKEYTLSATTELEGTGAETEPALRGRLQLTIPLK